MEMEMDISIAPKLIDSKIIFMRADNSLYYFSHLSS